MMFGMIADMYSTAYYWNILCMRDNLHTLTIRHIHRICGFDCNHAARERWLGTATPTNHLPPSPEQVIEEQSAWEARIPVCRLRVDCRAVKLRKTFSVRTGSDTPKTKVFFLGHLMPFHFPWIFFSLFYLFRFIFHFFSKNKRHVSLTLNLYCLPPSARPSPSPILIGHAGCRKQTLHVSGEIFLPQLSQQHCLRGPSESALEVGL